MNSIDDEAHQYQGTYLEPDILSEEADIGECEYCGKIAELNTGIICEGCSAFLDRRMCLRNHNCGILTDRNGLLIKLGDQLKYPENVNIFTVIEMLSSFVRVGACMVERRRDKERLPAIPRLMEHI